MIVARRSASGAAAAGVDSASPAKRPGTRTGRWLGTCSPSAGSSAEEGSLDSPKLRPKTLAAAAAALLDASLPETLGRGELKILLEASGARELWLPGQ